MHRRIISNLTICVWAVARVGLRRGGLGKEVGEQSQDTRPVDYGPVEGSGCTGHQESITHQGAPRQGCRRQPPKTLTGLSRPLGQSPSYHQPKNQHKPKRRRRPHDSKNPRRQKHNPRQTQLHPRKQPGHPLHRHIRMQMQGNQGRHRRMRLTCLSHSTYQQGKNHNQSPTKGQPDHPAPLPSSQQLTLQA